jgi:hypothetical protein
MKSPWIEIEAPISTGTPATPIEYFRRYPQLNACCLFFLCTCLAYSSNPKLVLYISPNFLLFQSQLMHMLFCHGENCIKRNFIICTFRQILVSFRMTKKSSAVDCLPLRIPNALNHPYSAAYIISHQPPRPSGLEAPIRCSCRPQWSRGLRHEQFSPARTWGLWFRIPLETWMSVCVYSVFVLFCV